MKKRNFNTVTDGHDEWLTPKYITDTFGLFDLDPCSPGIRRPWDTAQCHLDESDDGLTTPWSGTVWCNPPYGRETFKWLAKLADHGNGIALVFARTETVGFFEQVWNRADAVFFFKGRLRFCRVDGTEADTANAPSCLIAYGKPSVEKLRSSGFSGKLVVLAKPEQEQLLRSFKKYCRDDTEHLTTYYLASEVDAAFEAIETRLRLNQIDKTTGEKNAPR